MNAPTSPMTVIRLALTLVSALATFFFIYWLPFSFLPPSVRSSWVPFAVSGLCALLVGWYVWNQFAARLFGFLKCVILGAVLTGAIGFVFGFFGPLIWAPDANQGPLLGIFITGPLGFLLGAIGGAVYWFKRGRARFDEKRSARPAEPEWSTTRGPE